MNQKGIKREKGIAEVHDLPVCPICFRVFGICARNDGLLCVLVRKGGHHAGIIIPANGYPEVEFRIHPHLVVHEWLEQVGMTLLVEILVCGVSWEPHHHVWTLRLEAGGSQRLEADDNHYPGQPEQHDVAYDYFVHESFLRTATLKMCFSALLSFIN